MQYDDDTQKWTLTEEEADAFSHTIAVSKGYEKESGRPTHDGKAYCYRKDNEKDILVAYWAESGTAVRWAYSTELPKQYKELFLNIMPQK